MLRNILLCGVVVLVVVFLGAHLQFGNGEARITDVGKAPRVRVRHSQSDAPVASAGNVVYHNPRYGFRVTLPAGFNSSRVPDNGDGRSFRSSDGTILVSVIGSYRNNPGGPFEEELDEWERELTGHIRVSILGIDGFSLAWQDAKTEQAGLVVVRMGQTVENVLRISYPLSEAVTQEKTILQIANSFVPGPINSME